jgi:hypothetical protein
MKWDYIIGNFCEKKIWGSHPEWLNCLSCFFISYIPYMGLKYSKINSETIKNILSFLFIGGFTAFLYHWNGYYISKHLDEVPMILSIWLGLKKILSINNLNIYFQYILNIYFVLLLSINSIPNFDNYFPILFTFPCLLLIPLLLKYYICMKHTCKNEKILIGKHVCFKGMLLSIMGALSWVLSENYCHPLMILGHSLWHIFFSLGMFYILTSIDYMEQIKDNRELHIHYYYKIPLLI